MLECLNYLCINYKKNCLDAFKLTYNKFEEMAFKLFNGYEKH
jgi:hypothetical protein